jgi:hypothetical protein
MKTNQTTPLPPCFANPKPVKREENPGVLLIVNGKFVPADAFIYASEISKYLALKWVEELRQEVHKLETAILRSTDALHVSVLAAHVEEILALEQDAYGYNDQGEQG